MSHTFLAGVAGAGTMGRGIAQSAILGGVDVRLFDSNPQALQAAVAAIGQSLERSVAKGKITLKDATSALERLHSRDSLDGLTECDIVIEAIIESFEAKSGLFQSLERLSPSIKLATNTSSMRVDDLAARMDDPTRLMGLHYFFPAAVNPLIEVIRGKKTSDAAMLTAQDFVRLSRKVPLICNDSYGFAVNRFFVPYMNEAVRLVNEGIAPDSIDSAARQHFQTNAGPLHVMDLTKAEISLHASRTLERLGLMYGPPQGLETRVAQGLEWRIEPAHAASDGEISAISKRLTAPVFMAVLEAVGEGVAEPVAFDLGAKLGLQWGWHPWRAMTEMGRPSVEPIVVEFAKRFDAAVPEKGLALL